MDVNENAGLFEGYQLKLNSYDLGVDIELADAILGEAKVAFVPGEAFGTPGYARFSFAMADADMEEGIRRIHQWVTA